MVSTSMLDESMLVWVIGNEFDGTVGLSTDNIKRTCDTSRCLWLMFLESEKVQGVEFIDVRGTSARSVASEDCQGGVPIR